MQKRLNGSKLIRKICVFCGSGKGRDPAFTTAARQLGQDMAKADIGLIYGGGGLGLMGEVARAVRDNQGHVTGIIPEFLADREMMLRDVQELIITKSMHERKQHMFAKTDAFVALPGGAGTLDELFEQLTWAQLGRHRKPIVVANIAGYWQPMLELIEHMREENFIRPGLELHYVIANEAADIIPAILRQAEDNPHFEVEESFPNEL